MKTILGRSLLHALVVATAALATTIVMGEGADTGSNLGNLKPRAAEIAPLAAQSLLLDLAVAGEGLVAVGDRGSILRSPDGKTWTQVAVPVHVTLTAVDFADARNGWAVGHDGAILHTADGGASWQLQHFDPATNKPLLGVLALDAQRAIGVGAFGLLLVTADAGKTWSAVDAPALLEEGLHLNTAIRLGNGELFTVGEIGLIGISADGVTWERLTLPYDGSLFGALPLGEKGALVFGLRGTVLRSDDVRGSVWTPVEIGSVLAMYGGATLADGGAVLVGADGEIVHLTADGQVHRAQLAMAASALGGGSLAAVLPWKDQLLIVGEAGVSHAKLPK